MWYLWQTMAGGWAFAGQFSSPMDLMAAVAAFPGPFFVQRV